MAAVLNCNPRDALALITDNRQPAAWGTDVAFLHHLCRQMLAGPVTLRPSMLTYGKGH
jgi:hypothetical protein